MVFRFRLGFRREEAGGTGVQTADPPTDGVLASENLPMEAPTDVPASGEAPAERIVDAVTQSAATPFGAIGVESPLLQASAAKSGQAELTTESTQAPTHAPDPGTASVGVASQVVPQAEVEASEGAKGAGQWIHHVRDGVSPP